MLLISLDLREVKEHEDKLAQISQFNKDQLKHQDPKEKVVLPSSDGKVLSNACQCGYFVISNAGYRIP